MGSNGGGGYNIPKHFIRVIVVTSGVALRLLADGPVFVLGILRTAVAVSVDMCVYVFSPRGGRGGGVLHIRIPNVYGLEMGMVSVEELLFVALFGSIGGTLFVNATMPLPVGGRPKSLVVGLQEGPLANRVNSGPG